MEKEFVPYEQALALKELGFDEPCFGYYDNQRKEIDTISTDVCERLCKHDTHIKAPSFSQAFRWFRKKQAIEGFIHKAIEGAYYFVIKRLGNNENNMYEFITNAPKNVDTYEEAELECLKKLIEIVETKSE